MTEAVAEALAEAVNPAVAAAADTGAAPVPSEDDELGSVYDRLVTNNGADRGEGGKFTSKPDGTVVRSGSQEVTGEEAEAAKALIQQGKADAKPENAAEQPAEVPPPPAHMPQAIKDSWKDIPESARTAIAAHQAEVDRKFGEVGAQLRAVKPIADRLTAVTQQFPEFQGRTPEQLAQGAAELAAVQVRLEKDPVGTILQIAQHYGALDGIVARLSGQQPSEQAGQVQQLTGTIRELQNKIQELSDPNRVDQRIAASMAQRDADNIVADFAKGKEFYADVEASLPAFIQMAQQTAGDKASMTDILESAYDMAVNAIPAVREKARAAERSKAAQTPDPKRTEAAKKAASINVKSSSTGKEAAMSDEDAMAAAYDRAMAG